MPDSDLERPARTGSLLAAQPMDESPAERHRRARARRERVASPLFSPPTRERVAIHEHDEPAPRRGLKDILSGWTTRTSSEEQDEPAALQWADVAAPPEARNETGESRPGARLVVSLTVAGAVLGATVALALPRSYLATSELLIDPRGGAGAGGQLSADAAFALVDNQMRVLRSGTMLNAAAERLNLASDPEFNGEGAGLGLGGLLSGLGDILTDNASGLDRKRQAAVDNLASALEVERAGGASVITVTAETSDPAKSALIANTIAEVFMARTGGGSAGDAGLSERLAELREGVEQAERAIETFKAENEIIDAQGRLITDDEIVRLADQLSAARARTVELNARAASTRDANVDSIVTGSLPEQFGSPTLTELRTQYANLRQQADRLEVKLGPRHPERLAIQAQLEGAREGIAAELRRVASSLQVELKRAVQQEQELASQLAQMKVRQGDLGDEMVALRELEREAEAKRSVYEEHLRQAQGGQPAATADVSLISRAEPPMQASGLSLQQMSLAGALAGLLAGLGISGLRRSRRDGNGQFATSADPEPAETTMTADSGVTPHPENDAKDRQEAPSMHYYPYYPYAPAPHAEPPQEAMPGDAHLQPAPSAPMAQAIAYPQPAAWMPPHPGYQPMPGYPAMAQPAWPAQPMPQHDPWAWQRHMAPHYPFPVQAPASGHAHYPPAPPAAYTAPPNPEPVERLRPRRSDEEYDHDAFIDERTNAAIDEIRQSLREFREAIEDFADRNEQRRRYG